MSDDVGQARRASLPASEDSPVEAFRGTTHSSLPPIEGPAERGDPFEEESPSWTVAPPRSLRAESEISPIEPGGLFVGAQGTDHQGLTYQLIAPLDRGGMGELFMAEVSDGSGNAQYAVVKRLLPELMDDRDYVEMFRSEAEVMSQLDHPSVVRVLGMPELEGAPCLALEYVDGRSVQQVVSRARRLRVTVPPGIAAYIAARVGEALDHAHHAKDPSGAPLDLVHRDVSPGNVLVGFNGAVKLTDFGIAKSRVSAVSTTVGIVKGKARYLAPEQILGKPATPQSDLFSNALVLVEMLTGRPLFERGSIPKTLYAIVHGERKEMSELLSGPAAIIAPILEMALATRPEHRLPHARAFAEELNRLTSQLGPPVDPVSLGQHLRGLFAGTQGPLTRAVAVPPVPLPKTGSAPLDPSMFKDDALSLDHVKGLTPLPLLEPVEAEPARSAPNEVDEALSVLAWLQARNAETPPEEARTVMASPLPKKERLPYWLFFGGLMAGMITGLVIATLLASPPEAVELVISPESAEADQGLIDDPEALDDVGELEDQDLPQAPAVAASSSTEAHPSAARLEVSSPRGARVFVNGVRLRGRVPLRNIPLEPGNHTILVKGRKTRDRLFEVSVKHGETLSIGRNLRRRPTKPVD